MDMSESIEYAISSYFSQWMAQHPYLAWSIAHPLPSLGLILLAIFSLWGLINAIGREIEQIWLFLLKTPFKLFQPIFKLIWGSIQRIIGHTNPSASQLTEKSTQDLAAERTSQIIDRLQALSQEQDLLLQELSTLMPAAASISGTDAKSDTQCEDLSVKLPKFNQRQH
jgi:hypothetical protein